MLKSWSLTALLAASMVLPAVAQTTAHNDRIVAARPDGRGDAIITKGDNGLYKFWNIKDGSLAASANENTPEWHAKMLRYKAATYSRMDADLTRTWDRESSTSDWDYYNITSKEGSAGRLKFPKGSIKTEDYHRSSNRLILTGIKKGNTWSMWIFDPVKSKEKAEEFDSWTYTGEAHLYPSWSPSGKYIVCDRSYNLWNVDTKKRMRLEGLTEKDYGACVFTKDEAHLCITSQSGLSVYETATGKRVSFYPIPAELKAEDAAVNVIPCADTKSILIFHEPRNWKDESYKTNPRYRRAWLVTEGKIVTELRGEG